MKLYLEFMYQMRVPHLNKEILMNRRFLLVEVKAFLKFMSKLTAHEYPQILPLFLSSGSKAESPGWDQVTDPAFK